MSLIDSLPFIPDVFDAIRQLMSAPDKTKVIKGFGKGRVHKKVACPLFASRRRILVSAQGCCAPPEADRYGVGGTDLYAVAAVDAVGRPVRLAFPL